MTTFELKWNNPNFKNNETVIENIDAENFETIGEEFINMLTIMNLSENNTCWQIKVVDNGHICVKMDNGKCLVRGW